MSTLTYPHDFQNNLTAVEGFVKAKHNGTEFLNTKPNISIERPKNVLVIGYDSGCHLAISMPRPTADGPFSFTYKKGENEAGLSWTVQLPNGSYHFFKEGTMKGTTTNNQHEFTGTIDGILENNAGNVEGEFRLQS